MRGGRGAQPQYGSPAPQPPPGYEWGSPSLQEDRREPSVSPGKESTFGDEERVVLNSVIARLQHGIELAGDPAASYPSNWHQATNLDRLRGRLSLPPHESHDGSNKELRMQLDRAGIVIAQQLETSSRKDILMEEQAARCRIEKINAQLQLERIYEVLTEERGERCATEEALMEQLNGAQGEKEKLVHKGKEQDDESKEKIEALVQDYEERLATMADTYREALEEASKKQDEIRREAREELQEAAERQSGIMAEAEAKRREEKEASESTSDLLLLQIEELEQRLELYEEADLTFFGCAVDAAEDAVEQLKMEGAARTGEVSTELQEMCDEHKAELEAESLRHGEELKEVTERLEEALHKEQACSEDYRRLLEEATSEHERLRTELESTLRGDLTDLNRMASR